MLLNQKGNYGNGENYLKDKTGLWKDDKITEIYIFI